MSETPSADISDLWGIYQAYKAQLEAIQAEKLAWVGVLTALRTGNQPDITGITDSGEGGSEAYTALAAQDHIDRLSASERDVAQQMYAARIHAIKAGPHVVVIPVSRHHGRGWGW